MIAASAALTAIQAGLRDPLLAEYQSVVQNFMEHRWLPSELSGGRFSEIVYTILDGHAKGAYAAAPTKPGNFEQACKKLENNAHAPRSFQILIPRGFHKSRQIEFDEKSGMILILPPGAKTIQEILRTKNISVI